MLEAVRASGRSSKKGRPEEVEDDAEESGEANGGEGEDAAVAAAVGTVPAAESRAAVAAAK